MQSLLLKQLYISMYVIQNAAEAAATVLPNCAACCSTADAVL